MKSFFLFVCVALIVGVGSATAQNAGSPNPESSAFSGKVLETINASAYTYILVESGTAKIWAAAPRFEVKPGDSVDVTNGMAMPKFHSDTLKRDFDLVYFTGSVAVNGKSIEAVPPPAPAALPKNHPPIGGQGNSAPSAVSDMELPKDHPPIGKRAAAPTDFSGIKKVDNGKTVAEIVTGRTELAGMEVVVRGKVVKFNDGVLGKNWLHIRDGSGDVGSNDLTITTAAVSKVGDIVVVKGKVAVDRDFGSGYKYSVIIEDAQITVE